MKLMLFSLRDKSTTNICFLLIICRIFWLIPSRHRGSLPQHTPLLPLCSDWCSIGSQSAGFISRLYQHPNLPTHSYPKSRFGLFLAHRRFQHAGGWTQKPPGGSYTAPLASQAHSSFHKGINIWSGVRCSHFSCANKDPLTQANTDFTKTVFGLYT